MSEQTKWKSLSEPQEYGPWGDISKKDNGHHCEGHSATAQAGQAIEYCYEEETGELWVGNSEYENQVNFCPFCGKEATVAASELEEEKECSTG